MIEGSRGERSKRALRCSHLVALKVGHAARENGGGASECGAALGIARRQGRRVRGGATGSTMSAGANQRIRQGDHDSMDDARGREVELCMLHRGICGTSHKTKLDGNPISSASPRLHPQEPWVGALETGSDVLHPRSPGPEKGLGGMVATCVPFSQRQDFTGDLGRDRHTPWWRPPRCGQPQRRRGVQPAFSGEDGTPKSASLAEWDPGTDKFSRAKPPCRWIQSVIEGWTSVEAERRHRSKGAKKRCPGASVTRPCP